MRVDDSKIQLTLKQRPKNFQVAYIGGGVVSPSCGPIQVDAACTVLAAGGSPVKASNPRTAPWKLGFMQARILETNWAYYRGAQPGDGSVLVDKVARQSLRVCRDYEPADLHVFYEGSATAADCYGVPDPAVKPPWNLSLIFGDQPVSDARPFVLNQQTGKRNYLDEGRVSMGFVTTLTELAGPGRFVHHRHFFWTIIWHYKAVGGPSGNGQGPFALQPSSGFWISAFHRGAPRDARYRAILDDPTLTPSCNAVAVGAPPLLQEASAWQRLPLMDAPDKMF